MSPQFVDYDGDGHIDIVVGTFSGSPFVSRGSAAGFGKPEQILDRGGNRIVLNQFWNYETKEWDETKRCDPQGTRVPQGHATSAIVFDWDGDGDLDLLLGDYDGGRLYLRRNEGDAKNPAFATRNEIVRAGGAPLEVNQHLMTPRIVRRADGRADLLVTSGGDGHGKGAGGGVFLFRDRAERGEPDFAAAEALVPAETKGGSEPRRPDSGLYAELVDIDGDGDLDLLVGGYSHWSPPPRKLSDAEAARAKELEVELARLRDEQQKLYQEMFARESAAGKGEAGKKAREEFLAANMETLTRLQTRIQEIESELDELLAKPKRHSFVWLYANLAAQDGAASGSQ